jgi:Polyketide cyclase / dehydrase and lipid transport
MWKKILVILVIVLVAFVVVVAVQPDEFQVTRSETIAAAPAVVFAQVNDFRKWEGWSPWAKVDPNMKQRCEGRPGAVGASLSWSGNSKVGEGTMTLIKSHPPEVIQIQLDFEKPMKATNLTEFAFTPQGQATLVTWTMSGRQNFVQKAFCLLFNGKQMVGRDFEKGLAKMKSQAEAGAKT